MQGRLDLVQIKSNLQKKHNKESDLLLWGKTQKELPYPFLMSI